MAENSYEFAPSKFFLTQQHAFRNSPDNAIFARKIHRELAAVAEGRDGPLPAASAPRYSSNDGIDHHLSSGRQQSRSPSSGRSRRWHNTRRSPGAFPLDDSASDHSEKNLVDPVKNFGGIHICNEVAIDVSELTSGGSNPDLEMTAIPLGYSTEAGVGDVASTTFADELMVIATDERRRQRSGVSG